MDPIDPAAPETACTPPGRLRPFWRVARVLGVAYLGWCGFLFFAQDYVLFPVSMVARPPSDRLPPNVERLWIEIDGGARVEGWLVSPDASHQSPTPAIIFFHGNAETIDDSIGHAEMYAQKGYAVLLPEYRGYGRSGGSPSQSAIGADMIRFYDLLAAHPRIDATRIALHGRSIGGGFACDLARTRRPAAMVLESTFTSVAGFCWGMGVPPVLCRNPFRNDEVVAMLDVPMLIMHGADDTIIPVTHARALRGLARNARYCEQPADHNNFPSDWRRYEREIGDFLKTAFARAATPAADAP